MTVSLAGAAVVLLPGLLVTRDAAGLSLTGAERVAAVNQVRTTLLQAVGGLLVAAGVVATWRQLQVAREGQVTERFTRAIDQLGSPEVDVRIGGIYGLERIARDSPRDRVTVTEVLTAFVRNHAPWPPKARQDSAANAAPPRIGPLTIRAPDVQATMTVLGRANWRDHSAQLELSDTDLRSANLRHCDLHGARFHDAHLEDAALTHSNLHKADFGNAHLQGARLRLTDLRDVDFHDAHLEQANLRGAQLDGADFRVDEGERGACLQGADLRGARLSRAKLAGADLRGATADATTIWPPGFDPVTAGVALEPPAESPATQIPTDGAAEA